MSPVYKRLCMSPVYKRLQKTQESAMPNRNTLLQRLRELEDENSRLRDDNARLRTEVERDDTEFGGLVEELLGVMGCDVLCPDAESRDHVLCPDAESRDHVLCPDAESRDHVLCPDTGSRPGLERCMYCGELDYCFQEKKDGKQYCVGCLSKWDDQRNTRAAAQETDQYTYNQFGVLDAGPAEDDVEVASESDGNLGQKKEVASESDGNLGGACKKKKKKKKKSGEGKTAQLEDLLKKHIASEEDMNVVYELFDVMNRDVALMRGSLLIDDVSKDLRERMHMMYEHAAGMFTQTALRMLLEDFSVRSTLSTRQDEILTSIIEKSWTLLEQEGICMYDGAALVAINTKLREEDTTIPKLHCLRHIQTFLLKRPAIEEQIKSRLAATRDRLNFPVSSFCYQCVLGCTFFCFQVNAAAAARKCADRE